MAGTRTHRSLPRLDLELNELTAGLTHLVSDTAPALIAILDCEELTADSFDRKRVRQKLTCDGDSVAGKVDDRQLPTGVDDGLLLARVMRSERLEIGANRDNWPQNPMPRESAHARGHHQHGHRVGLSGLDAR